MTWIHSFSSSRIPFYIYKLQSGDSIIKTSKDFEHQSMIILNGIVYMIQVFTNKEALPIAILNKNNIIDINCYLSNYKSYYKVIAIEETYIISFSSKDLKTKNKITLNLFNNLLEGYKLTIQKHEIMRQILAHKYIKHRVIQLILFLSIEFGIINNHQIRIPFMISKHDIAIITGTNINTTNKILKLLTKHQLIYYSTQQLLILNDYFIPHSLFLLN